MSSLDPLSFKGLHSVIQGFSDEPYSFVEQANNDLDAEKEAVFSDPQPTADKDEEMDVLEDMPMPPLIDYSDDEDNISNEPVIPKPSPAQTAHRLGKQEPLRSDPTPSAKTMDSLRHILNEASKGVSQDMATGYQRIMKKSEEFLVKRGLIETGKLFISEPHNDSAEMIVAVIMDLCDSINLDGSMKDASEMRNGYMHAQKI